MDIFLKTKTVRGHLNVILSKEAINEINREVVSLLNEVLAALRAMGTGSDCNCDNLGEKIIKIESKLQEHLLESYKTEIRKEIEMKNNYITLRWKVAIVLSIIIGLISVLYQIISL